MWNEKEMILPLSSPVSLPHPDMPIELIPDYQEARSIVLHSPRGAAALLRLILQHLMRELGEKGHNINDDIANLVKKGLPTEVQQALDILRVVGNESVHPGEMDLRDDIDTACQLFDLVNFIVEDRITRKKKIAGLYDKLPQSKREHITTRDQK